MSRKMQICEVQETLIAFPDVSLVDTKVVHPSVFQRSATEMRADCARPGPGPGVVMASDAMVEQAGWPDRDHGFRALKLRSGALEPDFGIETPLKLRAAFVRHRLRADLMSASAVRIVFQSTPPIGNSLAAKCRVAAATPNLNNASDTHCPWSACEVAECGWPIFVDGAREVPEGSDFCTLWRRTRSRCCGRAS